MVCSAGFSVEEWEGRIVFYLVLAILLGFGRFYFDHIFLL